MGVAQATAGMGRRPGIRRYAVSPNFRGFPNRRCQRRPRPLCRIGNHPSHVADNRKGHLVANSLQRYGFTSQELVRGADGGFEIRIASRSRSGNWLPTGGIERYALMLRLYDTPVGVATRTQRDAPMPSIATAGCP